MSQNSGNSTFHKAYAPFWIMIAGTGTRVSKKVFFISKTYKLSKNI